VPGLRGVAGARGQSEGLERPRVGLGHAVQHQEEQLVGQRVERRRGGGGGRGGGWGEGEREATALGVPVLLLLVGCHGRAVVEGVVLGGFLDLRRVGGRKWLQLQARNGGRRSRR